MLFLSFISDPFSPRIILQRKSVRGCLLKSAGTDAPSRCAEYHDICLEIFVDNDFVGVEFNSNRRECLVARDTRVTLSSAFNIALMSELMRYGRIKLNASGEQQSFKVGGYYIQQRRSYVGAAALGSIRRFGRRYFPVRRDVRAGRCGLYHTRSGLERFL